MGFQLSWELWDQLPIIWHLNKQCGFSKEFDDFIIDILIDKGSVSYSTCSAICTLRAANL